MGPFILLITFLLCCNCTHYCNNNYQCQLQIISNISVYCNGYFSCFQAPSIEAYDYLYCYGSHSCYKVNTITSIYSRCYGLYSCAFVQNMNGKVNANGAYSMYGVINGNTVYTLYNRGYLSCYNCTHNVNGYVDAFGALALHNSYINVTAFDTSSIYLYSYLALYNGELFCSSGTECIMYCQGGNSCEKVTFTCSVGATCSVNCQYSTKNELCPNALYADWLEDIKYEKLFENESSLKKYNWLFSTDENSNEICGTSNAINCDRDHDATCYQQNILNIYGPICCTGALSCYQNPATNYYQYVNDPNINSTDDVAIRCDSQAACRNGNIKTEYGGNIYCSGQYGCANSKINATEHANVFCEGSESCQFSNIYDAKNILCTGWYGCGHANIYNLAGNVYGLTSWSLQYTSIHNIVGNIYCLAWQAARYTIIERVNNIYGNSFECFYESQISNVNNLYLVG
eukprot:7433_1